MKKSLKNKRHPKSLWQRWTQDKVKRWLLIGLIGVVLAFICGAGLYAVALPPKGTADAPLHIDYAWQLYHGHLPSFWQGMKAPLGSIDSKVQFVSQHPPLYYALIAPAIGPFTDIGHWQVGVAFARVITMGLGVLCVAALAWGGWVLGGKDRALFALAVPAVGTSLVPFIKVSGDIMNDTLAVLTATIALGVAALLLRRGPTIWLVITAVAISILGMASRATFISALLMLLGAVMVGAYLHSEDSKQKRILRGVMICVAIALAVLVTSGWFYWRNYKASGHWYRSGPQSWAATILHKPKKSFREVITDPTVWLLVPDRLYGKPWEGWSQVVGQPFNVWLSVGLIVFGLSGAIYWLWRKHYKWRKLEASTYWTAAMLLAYSLFVFAQQVRHATGYGGYNVRYFLPMWLPLCLALSAGLLVWRKLRGQAVIFVVALNWLMTLLNTLWYLGQVHASTAGNWQNLLGFVRHNGLPAAVVYLLIIGLVAGIAVQATAFWHLTSRPSKR